MQIWMMFEVLPTRMQDAKEAGVSIVVDVGGGDGQFVLALLAANPGLRGQVLDLPHAVEAARREARKRGLAARFSAVAATSSSRSPRRTCTC